MQCCCELWCRSDMQLKSGIAITVVQAGSCSSNSTLSWEILCAPGTALKKKFLSTNPKLSVPSFPPTHLGYRYSLLSRSVNLVNLTLIRILTVFQELSWGGNSKSTVFSRTIPKIVSIHGSQSGSGPLYGFEDISKVLIVAHQVMNPTRFYENVGLIPGLRTQRRPEMGGRPAAAVPIQPLAQQIPYVAGVALKS